jgi:hypothetical protein
LNKKETKVQEVEMEELQTMNWAQLSAEVRLRVIAVLVEMLLAYLAQQRAVEDETA